MSPVRFSLLLVPALVLAGCAATSAPMAPAAPPTAAMTDADLLDVFVASNEAEILTSRPVEGSDNAEVRQFARDMIAMHQPPIAQAQALAVDPRPNAVSLSMRQMVAGKVRQLTGASPADRDRLYMETQVVLHGHTLDMLDHVLIPNARDAQVRGLFQQARPMVDEHLRRAKAIHHGMMAAMPMTPGQ